MVSVVFAIRLLEPPKRLRSRPGRPVGPPPNTCAPVFLEQATCQFLQRRARLWRRYCMALGTGADVNDVNDVPSLSEPHGSDVAMADRGCGGPEISQPRATGRLRQAVR